MWFLGSRFLCCAFFPAKFFVTATISSKRNDSEWYEPRVDTVCGNTEEEQGQSPRLCEGFLEHPRIEN